MASGLGLRGNTGRCFPFMQDFRMCMKESDDPIKECLVLRDDYLECLHHRKELNRIREVAKQEEINANPELAESKGGHGGGGH